MIKKFIFPKKKKNPCLGKKRVHVLSVVNHNKMKGVGQDKCIHGTKTAMTISRVTRGERARGERDG